MKTTRLPFIPTYVIVLLSSSKVTLLNVSTGSSRPTQKPVLKYFFAAQLCSEKWNTVAFPDLVVLCSKVFACVYVLEQHPSDSCIHMDTERWVFKKQKETLCHCLIQTKLTWRQKHAALDINYCLATGREILAYQSLGKATWIFFSPYLHIFYHLLCKEGCKCKHRIHLCWDKMRAHHSLIQQRIHQHLQKTTNPRSSTLTKQTHKTHVSRVLFVASICFKSLSYCQEELL